MNKPEKNQNYKVDKSTIISLERGKIPPQALDLEEVVLGAMMIDKNGASEVFEILREEKVFYKEAHQEIYETMLSIFKDNEPIDLLTVSQRLKEKSKLDAVGGDFYLISLTQKVSSSAHIEFHCRILMQMYVKRESIKVANTIIEKAYNDETDIFDLLADSQKRN